VRRFEVGVKPPPGCPRIRNLGTVKTHASSRRVTAKEPIRALFAAAGVSYAASCAVGTGVASGALDLHGARWVHHALYICTATLAGAAVSSLVWSTSRAGWMLLPAAVPLAALARLGPRFPRHPLVALAAAPFFVAGIVYSRR
jgi:hypothetical protein